MTYFNHAFKKTLVATGGKFTGENKTSADLAKAGFGKIGLFDKQYKLITSWDGDTIKSFYIATSTPYASDKLNQYLGGFQETDKSKLINPKYVSKVWVERATRAQQCEYVIGLRDNDGTLEDCAPCESGEGVFKTGNTYYLRVEAKGTPAMMFSTHNLYHDVEAYTGCASYDENGVLECVGSPSTVYVQWLRGIAETAILKDFVAPVLVAIASDNKYYFTTEDVRQKLNESGAYNIVFDTTNNLTNGSWYEIKFEKDGNYMDGYFTLTDVIATDAIATAIASVSTFGLVLRGAYYDTKFGDCSWSKTDYYGVEPIRIFAQQVDVTGNVCEDQFVCGWESHPAIQGNGYGEQKLREYLLAQSYRQNFRADDARIREITGGDELMAAVPRNAKYDSIFIQHNVPRFNNPTSVFDNDQYVIEILVEHGDPDGIIADLVAMFDAILENNGASEVVTPVLGFDYVEETTTNINIGEYIVDSPVFKVTAEAGVHGTITPTSATVSAGDSISFLITPDEDYEVDTFTDNGVDKKAEIVDGVYSISNVSADHTIDVTFSHV